MFIKNTNSWTDRLIKDILNELKNMPLWQEKIDNAYSSINPSINLHLAIFSEPYLTYLLEGKKTFESRFSIKKYPPYERISEGDIIFVKKVTGPVIAICTVKKRNFYLLNSNSWNEIKKFSKELCIDHENFWIEKKNCSYATIIEITDFIEIKPIQCYKRDRRGWVILRDIDPQMTVDY